MNVLPEFVLKRSWLRLLLVVLLTGYAAETQATHLRAGQIIVRKVGDNCDFTYEIIVTVYTNTGSPVLFGGEQDVLCFGDGVCVLVPETPNTILPEFGPNIGTASYRIVHTFPGAGAYTISYLEPNRNGGVLNMDASINTTFYLETQLTIDPFICNRNSPNLLIPPIDRACRGVAFFHNPGAYDADGDSLSYELVVPFRDRNQPVINYRPPNHPGFYGSCQPGNEEGNGPPTFSINPVDGTLLWDAPCQAGEYNIAFIVVEWRKVFGQWVRIGFVRRDMQIIVEDCNNDRPDLEVPPDLCVEAGTVINQTIFGFDPNNDRVKLEAFSEIFDPTFPSRATVTPFPPVFQNSNPPAQLQFSWTTTCDHVKEQPYQIVFKITDEGAPRLVTFKTWRIKVIGPPPQWVQANVNLAQRSADLEWQPYVCQNAETIQIWRRVASNPLTPDSCQTGMPPYWGYSLITTVPATGTTFTDTNKGKGLEVGAQYCYRLVAIFPQPLGGESYVSQEICIPPILADAPVITHVTVEKTDQNNGEIRISWRSPFDIDKTQFPGPYEYKVWRAQGFGGATGISEVHPGTLPGDTTVVDVGINTDLDAFNYRVVLYSNTVSDPTTWSPIDTSAVASSVRLDLRPSKNQIQLTWSAVVPWSNALATYPRHLIYRGPENATENDLVLIDSVDVLQAGFTYTDSGQWNNTPLVESQVYCYRVRVRGGYGNPAINEPLENYSQIGCAQPNDITPPCQPELVPFVVDCENFVSQYGCSPSNFVNVVRWRRPTDPVCREDTRSYNVYASASTTGQYFLLASNIRDTVFYDSALSSFARCYRISAVDRSGNESELSVPACNDNCPYYELPNLFTPNGDFCNDVFAAYGYQPEFDPEIPENYPCRNVTIGPRGENLQLKCARFVQSVNFRVYNRWGTEVYSYFGRQGDEQNTIYIKWDGRNKNGVPLNTGIYYYLAEVTFNVVDPSKRVQKIKGWVQIVR
jgi:hypothetical protein